MHVENQSRIEYMRERGEGIVLYLLKDQPKNVGLFSSIVVFI